MLGEMDLVVCSTSAPGSILTQADLKPHAARYAARPILLIDLAVPRDVEPSSAQITGVCLLNVDDLRQVASENLAVRLQERGKALAMLEPLVEKLISHFYKHGVLFQIDRTRPAYS